MGSSTHYQGFTVKLLEVVGGFHSGFGSMASTLRSGVNQT
jgi:hypothetical protein